MKGCDFPLLSPSLPAPHVALEGVYGSHDKVSKGKGVCVCLCVYMHGNRASR